MIRTIREYCYLIFKGRFLITLEDFKKVGESELGGHIVPVMKKMSPTKYANFGNTWPHKVTWTEVMRGASVFSFIAAILIRKALKKQMPGKDISLVTIQDASFLNHVFNGQEH
jgi:hypothetical protein